MHAERLARLARPRRNSAVSLSQEPAKDAHLARRKSVSVSLSPDSRLPHPIFARKLSSEGKTPPERRKSIASGASSCLPSLGRRWPQACSVPRRSAPEIGC
eukprot:2171383-Rhodomonas_salina.1